MEELTVRNIKEGNQDIAFLALDELLNCLSKVKQPYSKVNKNRLSGLGFQEISPSYERDGCLYEEIRYNFIISPIIFSGDLAKLANSEIRRQRRLGPLYDPNSRKYAEGSRGRYDMLCHSLYFSLDKIISRKPCKEIPSIFLRHRRLFAELYEKSEEISMKLWGPWGTPLFTLVRSETEVYPLYENDPDGDEVDGITAAFWDASQLLKK